MDTLASLNAFCRVAELKSFTAAAGWLRISPAMASKHVMHLERRLQTRLLNRTSRHVSLTEAGALYLDQARNALEVLEEAEAAIGNAAIEPSGTLRLSAPVWAASPPFASLLSDYRRRYPLVRLDIDLSGRMTGLVEEGFDIALRASATLDPGLIARPLAEVTFHLVAAPAYIERTGKLTSVDDLGHRDLLGYTPILGGGGVPLDTPDGERRIPFKSVLESGNETLLHLAALEGMGIALLPEWMIRLDLLAGRLQPVLPGFSGSTQLYAVYPSRKYLSAKVRTFLDLCAQNDLLRKTTFTQPSHRQTTV